jgi:hypothetical protein
MQQDVKAWKSARKAIFEECGGDSSVSPESYDSYIEDHKDTFDTKKWNKWNERNSKLSFI